MLPRKHRIFRVLPSLALIALPAVATGLDPLAGSWQSLPVAGAGAVRLAMEARPVLGGSWIRLELAEVGESGRDFDRHLMARQENGAAVGYLFTSGSTGAPRLEGSWSDTDGLLLESPDGESVFSWRPESECEAMVSVDGRRTRLRRADCGGTRMAAAAPAAEVAATTPEGRPAGAETPTPPLPAAPEKAPAAPPSPRRDSDAPQVAGETEIRVSELPAATRVDAAVADKSATVILAGRGKPLDEVQKAVEMLREFLVENGVAVEGPSDEIVVLQAADASLAYLVREVRDRGAASLLYVNAAFGGRERIVVDCYDGNGLHLWSERTVGGTGMRELRWMNPKLVERIEAKLKPRIGGIGLPAGAGSSP